MTGISRKCSHPSLEGQWYGDTSLAESDVKRSDQQQALPSCGRTKSCFPREERDQRDQDPGSPIEKNPRDVRTGKTLPLVPFLPFI